MRLIADLHIHSRFSMATSKRLDFVALYRAALEKGIDLVGTGDFTHPGWMAEIEEQLEPAEEGLFRLKPALAKAARVGLPPALDGDVRFVLQVEISNIYKRDGKTRKNHNLIYVPSLEVAKQITTQLAAIGNIKSDGRPILGLDARDLLDITLNAHPEAFLIPAHIWTPWFSMLGSKSGFDSLTACFGDLSREIFAVETGLSSDPAMNWQLSALDHLTLVSNSDAHSPDNLGREANLLDIELGFAPLRHALATRQGYLGTMEFYPDEGKYHLDGHRKCNVRLSPKETAACKGICPVCGKPITVGVLTRVAQLADRTDINEMPNRFEYSSIVPLATILAEVLGQGPKTKKVADLRHRLTRTLGPELPILQQVPIENILRVAGSVVAEAIKRVRAGDLIIDGGYDGEFGSIKIFDEQERATLLGQGGLFPVPAKKNEKKSRRAKKISKKSPPSSTLDLLITMEQKEARRTRQKEMTAVVADPLAGLDEFQRRAAATPHGPLLVTAGPGCGKTRTLVARIALLVKQTGITGNRVLAVSFTRQAVKELNERLAQMALGYEQPQVHTFHSYCLAFLEEFHPKGVRPIATDEQRVEAARAALDDPRAGERVTETLLAKASFAKQHLDPEAVFAANNNGSSEPLEKIQRALDEMGVWDLDDLQQQSVTLLERDVELAAFVSGRFDAICVDEYQDINDIQARLLCLLSPTGKKLMAIGDPDQSIYSFRGSKVAHFTGFTARFSNATTVALENTYRLTDHVLSVASRVNPPHGLLKTKKSGVKVELVACPTPAAEAEQVVVRLQQLLGGTSHFAINSGRALTAEDDNLGFGDVALLVRTKGQRKELMIALERAGIPALKVGQEEPHDPRSQKVAVMTMHAAKGREFKVVFVLGVEEGLLPLQLGELVSDVDEERRLLYVAITRAIDLCVISYARNRHLWGIKLPGEPSRFLAQLPDEHLIRSVPTMKQRPRKSKQMSLL